MIRRMAGCSTWRMWASSSTCIRLASSTSPISPQQFNVTTLKSEEKNAEESDSTHSSLKSGTSKHNTINGKKQKISLVTAAFNSLHNQKATNVEESLQSAKTVEDVLSASETQTFSQYQALQALSVLAEWTTQKKIKMHEFESDPRFVNLCKLIGPKPPKNVNNITDLGDLGVVLSVTGEDQAAKMISGISFLQKIRVLSSLALKKRRSLHLLRALAANISNSSENFDIKQAADVLYAMAVLNFPDKLLLNKAVNDICKCLPDNTRPAVVGSILTSVGILKYKNKALLDELSNWVKDNISRCREQDIVSLLLTLASVNYQPQIAANLYKIILPALESSSVPPLVWLDVVWALSVLNVVDNKNLQSVLVPEFLEKLSHTGYITNIPAPARLKLLNINAVAELVVKDYKGPLLADSSSLQFPLQRSREKQILVDSVVDSLTNLLPKPTYLRTNINSGHGFLIDGECVVDDKCNPLPVENPSPESTAKRKRIAVLVCDYHDMCKECEEVSGPVALQIRILEHLGYSVMTVTHLEFKPRDKLVSRVKYLEKKLKKLAAH
ncbi:Uncharacterized protein GBIM_10735 [Gryllus bimaculatus]|nr:Uncharacterized protein GBIM_10735 [Gryllus bimaculatus]